MKKYFAILFTFVLILGVLSACGNTDTNKTAGTQIILSDSKITVNGIETTNKPEHGVHIANDIIYYEDGQDFTYGDGSENDAHSKADAESHTVVHITQPGNYILSGKLSKGQVAVDLGDEAKQTPSAVVTLTLDNADITCEVAPAIIFYNVYECGSSDEATASSAVDTSKAGAKVVIADGSENNIEGSYVAKIYEPDSVVLSSNKTEVEDAEKLHKYDAAFYSKMSMDISGGERGDGKLNITAENEGLDSELHLTVNSGNINIVSGNDGINTNEDNVSVTTVNGGTLNILVDGSTGEGDGIDSNGWLVINGGTVFAQGCATSGDAGIDSDKGIHINGGTVFATGNMLDRISESKQNFAVFTFVQTQNEGTYIIKNSQNETVLENNVKNNFTYLVVSDKKMTAGEYTLWNGEIQLKGAKAQSSVSGMMPTPPEGFSVPDGTHVPEDFSKPEGMQPPEMPDGMTVPEGMQTPDNMPPREERPDGSQPPKMPDNTQSPDRNHQEAAGEKSPIFIITDGENYFNSVTASE